MLPLGIPQLASVHRLPPRTCGLPTSFQRCASVRTNCGEAGSRGRPRSPARVPLLRRRKCADGSVWTELHPVKGGPYAVFKTTTRTEELRALRIEDHQDTLAGHRHPPVALGIVQCQVPGAIGSGRQSREDRAVGTHEGKCGGSHFLQLTRLGGYLRRGEETGRGRRRGMLRRRAKPLRGRSLAAWLTSFGHRSGDD